MARILSLLLAVVAAAHCVAADDDAFAKVRHLTDEDFDTFRAQNKQFFVMFYAPWCGHCKNMKGDYASAAKSADYMMPLVAVDCTVHKTVCETFSVNGFPTLKYFEDEVPQEYEGGRSAAALLEFVQSKYKVDPSTLDVGKLKVKALKALLTERGVDFKGLSEKEDLVKKVKESLHLPALTAAERAAKEKERIERKAKELDEKYGGRSWAQDNRMRKAREVAEKGWEPNGAVVHVIDDTWPAFRQANPKAMVMFHQSWCGACTSFKPMYAEISEKAKELGVAFGAIDCEHNKDLCEIKFKLNSYPTLHFFNNSDSDTPIQFKGNRDEEGILNFIRRVGLGEKIAPKVESWDVNGEVKHLGEETFDEFVAANKAAGFMVMFYAPWCGHCKVGFSARSHA